MEPSPTASQCCCTQTVQSEWAWHGPGRGEAHLSLSLTSQCELTMSATTINTITSLHHRPQLEPVDLSLANTENQSELERFLQRVREGRTELTIQVKYFPGYLLKYFLIY